MSAIGRFIIVLCVAAMALGACSTKKVSTQQMDYSRVVSEWKELAARYERRSEVYKDSLMMMKGLMEKSENVADSVSHLETSYALSDAAIRNGKLHHRIENKDSVSGRVRYIRIEVEKHDTIRIELRDTVYVEKREKKEVVTEKKLPWNLFFYCSGCVAWMCIVAGAGIWLRYKIKKGER